jgi:ParB/RepB/Spo0J family partition protein
MKENEKRVVDLAPADCISPEDNRRISDDDLAELLSSIDKEGQLVAGIVGLHPTVPGKYLVAAGNRRKRVCEILGIPFRAEVIDRVLSRTEIIRIRVGENVHRKKPSPFELCKDVSDYMEEKKLRTWAEVGRELSLVPVTLSRITSVKRIPADLRELAERVVPSVCWLIAALPNTDAMHKAFAYATTPIGNGTETRLPTREQVEKFLDQFRQKKTRGPKPKLIKGEVEGRTIAFSVEKDETGETLIEWFQTVKSRLGKYKESPAESLAFLFVD